MDVLELVSIMNSPAERLQHLMDADNLNQREVGDVTSLHHSTISKYLTASQTPSDSFLRRAEEKLGWSSKWIRTGQGPKRISISHNESVNTDQGGNQNSANINYKGQITHGSAESEIERLKRELAMKDEKIEDLKAQKRLLEEINQLLRSKQ